MTLEINDAVLFDTGGDFLDGFEESEILDMVCMWIYPLSFYFRRLFIPRDMA